MFTSRRDQVYHSHVNATNAPASITLNGVGRGKYVHLSRIIFSYSAAPTNGRLTVTSPDGTELDLPVSAAGVGPIGVHIRVEEPMIVTLAAGGSGVEGGLYVEYFAD